MRLSVLAQATIQTIERYYLAISLLTLLSRSVPSPVREGAAPERITPPPARTDVNTDDEAALQQARTDLLSLVDAVNVKVSLRSKQEPSITYPLATRFERVPLDLGLTSDPAAARVSFERANEMVLGLSPKRMAG